MSQSYRKDLTGQRFGRLTVLEFVPTKDKNSHWRCKCDCGKITTVRGSDLTYGGTKSCGCLNIEKIIEVGKIYGKITGKIIGEKYGGQNKTHDMSETKLYRTWGRIKSKCLNPNNDKYKYYGGRGITVCDEWQNNFQSFATWAIANGYDENLTIDRIDVNGNYEPSNCRWVDMKIQNRNRRSNILIEYNGQEMCIADIAKLLGIPTCCLYSRYHRGIRGEKLFRPSKKK